MLFLFMTVKHNCVWFKCMYNCVCTKKCHGDRMSAIHQESKIIRVGLCCCLSGNSSSDTEYPLFSYQQRCGIIFEDSVLRVIMYSLLRTPMSRLCAVLYSFVHLLFVQILTDTPINGWSVKPLSWIISVSFKLAFCSEPYFSPICTLQTFFLW